MYKKRIYELLEAPGDSLLSGKWLRFSLLTIILLNVLCVILQSVVSIEEKWGPEFRLFELFSVVVFSIEYIARLWSINAGGKYAGRYGRLRFIFSPLALIDIIALLPSLLFFGFLDLRFLRIVRMFRLLRVLKVGRYSKTLRRFGEVAMDTSVEMMLTFLAMVLMLIIGSGLMYFVERDAQPEVFSSIPAAMWWAIATLTTVGYGDTYPITIAGKLVASFVAIIGIGMFALPSGILGAAFLERIRKEKRETEVCPHCKRLLHDSGHGSEKS